MIHLIHLVKNSYNFVPVKIFGEKKPRDEKRGGELERVNQNPLRDFTPRKKNFRIKKEKRGITTVWMGSFRPQRTCRVSQL